MILQNPLHNYSLISETIMDFPPNCFNWSEEYLLKEMMMMREGCASSSSSSLVFESEKGEIVRALVRPDGLHHHHHHSLFNLHPRNQNGSKADKALMALRNHSEAERRRRERINGHLSVLRTLIPGTSKMDKASLLAEVISNLKQLRKTATKVISTKGLLIPMDIDEVKVEQQDDNTLDESSYSIKASLCCEYKHEVLSDLKQALDGLNLKTIRTEIATLGRRMVNIFEITGSKKDQVYNNKKDIESSVHQALKSVLDKFYASQEFSESNNKRQRVSFYTPSNSSSLGDFW